jgi:chemotaxis protein methyltransferase CheR
VKLETTPDPQLRVVMEFIQARTGLVFPPSRQLDAEARVRKAMEVAKIDDPRRFLRCLDADESIFDMLITSLTVSETYFFREPRQFEFIRLHILPELQRERPLDAELRFWSAGCASGEEAYSLAILLEQERLAQRACVLATDISGAVLSLARKASYNSWSFRGNDTDAMAQYFFRRNDRFVLQDRFRQRVAFRSLNLAVENYPSLATGTLNIDLILCRNVLIYFDQDTVAQVARRLFAALAEDGWLITGPSDPPLWDYAPFETKLTAAGVLYRRSRRIVSLPSFSEPAGSVDRISRLVLDEELLAAKGAATEFAQVVPQADPRQTLWQTPSLDGFDGEPPPSPELPNDIALYASSIRELADTGELHRAAATAAVAVQVHPLAAELHYMRAIVLAGLGQCDEASASLRRVIYLDPSLAVAHFTLGSILGRSGALADTRRCYRNALAFCAERPPQELLRLSEGETAGRMAEAARSQLAFIDGDRETKP